MPDPAYARLQVRTALARCERVDDAVGALLARAMLSARSKALRLAFVRSTAHRTVLIAVTSTPHHRLPRFLLPSGCWPAAPARRRESTVERHWQGTSRPGPDRSRCPLLRRVSAVRPGCSACLVHECQGSVPRTSSFRMLIHCPMAPHLGNRIASPKDVTADRRIGTGDGFPRQRRVKLMRGAAHSHGQTRHRQGRSRGSSGAPRLSTCSEKSIGTRDVSLRGPAMRLPQGDEVRTRFERRPRSSRACSGARAG